MTCSDKQTRSGDTHRSKADNYCAGKNARPDADHKGSFTTFFCASEHNGKIHVAHPQNKMVMGSVARELSGVIALLTIAPVA